MERYTDSTKLVATRFLTYFCAALIALVCIFLTIQVAGRYLMHSPPEWTEELARLAFVYATFIGGALAVARRAHLGIEIFVLALPRRPRAIFQIAWRIVACVALCVVAWKGSEVANRMWGQPLTSVPLSKGAMFAAVPIGMVLMLFYEVGRIVAEWRVFRTGVDPYEPAIAGTERFLHKQGD